MKMYKHYDEILAKMIKDIFEETKKGYRFIAFQLKRKYGLIINRKTTLRYMRIMGLLSPVRKKRFKCCTIRELNEKARTVCENVLARDFNATRPNEKLVTDVSYVYHQKGRKFLSVVKDLFDNSIVAYTISNFNDNKLVFDNIDLVLNKSWDKTKTCILHSDQGFQYTNKQYIERLSKYNITVSHSRKGNCYDNACCENFFSHLKSESLELKVPIDEKDLIRRIKQYIMWYNTDRPQEKLKGMTPDEFRKSYLKFNK